MLKKFSSGLVIALLALVLSGVTSTAQAALAVALNPTPSAKISITFDEGYNSTATQAAPTLAKYGLTATVYVTTGCVGMTTIPNTCHANNYASYISWAQISQLKNAGWEIGSHTVSHPYLASSDASDGQPNVLTPAEVTQELTKSKADLAAKGFDATSFATPYGDYNNTTLALIAKYYASHRGFADQNNNAWPHNEYLLNNMPVQEGVSVAQVKAKIDAAIANKQWLVLTLHDIKTRPSRNPDDYEYATAKLDQIAAYIKSKQTAGLIKSININQGFVTNDTNLLANGSFNSGIGAGWTTDSPGTISLDTAVNGSYPDPANSVKLVSDTTTKHLFSPKVSVDANTTYLLKNFLNVQTLTSGEVGFYIDEYDANGNWISGQYKAAERSVFVENINFTYKPTSVSVSQASLQVFVTGNSGITAYLDNVQWFALSVTPPAQTNLVANGTFDNGLADDWTTDSAATIVTDTASNGSPANPLNSIKLNATTTNTHLFSPKVAVDPTKSYSLSGYLNIQQLTNGVVGFYIDEYDINGNWVSGQYKTGISSIGAGNVGFVYSPSSASVKNASLQVIVSANSGVQAFFDDVRWYLN